MLNETGSCLVIVADPRTLKVAALLSKPSRRLVETPVDYTGFTIEDKFVVGYGLDYNEKHRNLRDIMVYQ